MPTENRSSNTELVSVPRVLTREMLNGVCMHPDLARSLWSALLKNAPQLPEQHQHALVGEVVAFGEGLHEIAWAAGRMPKLGAKLYTHADTAEVEWLRAVIEQQKNLIESLRAELAESHSIDASAEPCAPELTDDLREILGRPNFTCHFIAKALRVMGHSIAHKSEDEQAVVIHWLLGIYLKHGPDWRQRAAAELEEASQSFKT